MKIELRWWAGCPSYPEAKALVEEIIDERGIDAELVLREVRMQEQAEEHHFPGSPTILVDGRDVDPVGARARPALNCRIYHLPNGKISPIPSREQLEEALR